MSVAQIAHNRCTLVLQGFPAPYDLPQGCYGEKVHKAVVAAGVRYTGATVHFVDEEFDSGAILAQRVVPVFPTDTYSQVGVLDMLPWEVGAGRWSTDLTGSAPAAPLTQFPPQLAD